MTLLRLLQEERVHVRLIEGHRLSRSDDGKSTTVAGDLFYGPVRVAAYFSGFETSCDLLERGAPLGALRDGVLSSGGTSEAPLFLLLLQKLSKWGVLEFSIVEDAVELAVISPQLASYVPSFSAEIPSPDISIDRFACLRRIGARWLLESPRAGARFLLADLTALDRPLMRQALSASGFLEAGHPAEDPHEIALQQWEFHDLLFHFRHRMGWSRDPNGAFFPFIDEIEPLPAVRPGWPGEKIPLAKATLPTDGDTFAAVLERRRSERVYDEDRPITVGEFGALLDRAARIRRYDTMQVGNLQGRTADLEITHRPYPSGGASYELEIYPVVARCDGLDPGLYHYDAAEHCLVRISGQTPELDRIFEDARVSTARQADAQIVLAIAARFERVMWKYRAISYGVILRNTGALYQTLYLAATELGLSPCGIGSGDSALFAKVTGLDPVVEGTVGEFILGGRPLRP